MNDYDGHRPLREGLLFMLLKMKESGTYFNNIETYTGVWKLTFASAIDIKFIPNFQRLIVREPRPHAVIQCQISPYTQLYPADWLPIYGYMLRYVLVSMESTALAAATLIGKENHTRGISISIRGR